ncbi:MAG: M28 family peptidase [Thermoplasmata archaeon]
MNKRHGCLATLFVILIITTSYSAVYVYEKNTVVILNFDEDRAFSDMLNLTSFGPRISGSLGNRQGAEFIAQKFREAGLSNVHIEEYNNTMYEVKSASATLIYLTSNIREPVKRVEYKHMYDFAVQGYSGSTYGTVTLDIVDVGNGTDADYKSKDVKGKAVIVSTGPVNNTALLLQAAKYGAAANIIHNVAEGEYFVNMPYSTCPMWRSEDGLISKAFPDIFPDCKVPSIMVSKKVGTDIRNLLKNARNIPLYGSTVKIELSLDIPITKKPLLDVIGEIRGSGKPDEFILMGAHCDTQYNTVGAVDNTVGTVTLMEMARQLAKQKPERTIRFAAWDGEEIGLRGATEYYKAHKGEIANNMVFYMNFDWHNVNLERSSNCSVRVSDGKYFELFEKIKEDLFKNQPRFSQRYNFSVIVSNEIGADSDAYYNAAKKPVSDYRGSGQWEIHTPLDTVYDNNGKLMLNPESWALGGIMCGSFALKLANGG